MSDLGRRLRQLRERKKLSIYDVERRLGIHFSTVAKYERNERRPSLEVLRELAALYEVPLAQLIGDVGDLRGLLRDDQLRWLELLEGRPLLARLVTLAADLDDRRLDALVRFLEPAPPTAASGSFAAAEPPSAEPSV